MWFLFGLLLGGATASSGSSHYPVISGGIPAECLLSATEHEYEACRVGSMLMQTVTPGGTPLCGSGSTGWIGLEGARLKAYCDLESRMHVEWSGLQQILKEQKP